MNMNDCPECGRNHWLVSIKIETFLTVENGEITENTGQDGVESAECEACGYTMWPGEELSYETCVDLLDFA